MCLKGSVHANSVTINFKQAQFQTDIAALEAAVAERDANIEDLRQALDNGRPEWRRLFSLPTSFAAKVAFTEVSNRARGIYEEAQAVLRACPANIQEEFQRRKEQDAELSVEQLEQRAEDQRQQLESTAHVAGSVIKNYQKTHG